jgi:hypothetical protein
MFSFQRAKRRNGYRSARARLKGNHGNVRVGRARGNAGRTNAGLSDKSVQRFDTLPRLPSESVAALPRIPHK